MRAQHTLRSVHCGGLGTNTLRLVTTRWCLLLWRRRQAVRKQPLVAALAVSSSHPQVRRVWSGDVTVEQDVSHTDAQDLIVKHEMNNALFRHIPHHQRTPQFLPIPSFLAITPLTWATPIPPQTRTHAHLRAFPQGAAPAEPRMQIPVKLRVSTC